MKITNYKGLSKFTKCETLFVREWFDLEDCNTECEGGAIKTAEPSQQFNTLTKLIRRDLIRQICFKKGVQI